MLGHPGTGVRSKWRALQGKRQILGTPWFCWFSAKQGRGLLGVKGSQVRILSLRPSGSLIWNGLKGSPVGDPFAIGAVCRPFLEQALSRALVASGPSEAALCVSLQVQTERERRFTLNRKPANWMTSLGIKLHRPRGACLSDGRRLRGVRLMPISCHEGKSG